MVTYRTNDRPAHQLRLRPEWFFLIVGSISAIVLLVIMPPVSGWDENTHSARVEQLAELNLFSEEAGYANVALDPIGTSPDDLRLYGGEINAGYWAFICEWFELTHGAEEKFDVPNEYRIRSYSMDTDDTTLAVFSNTAVYSPLTYFPNIIGYSIACLLTKSSFWVYTITRLFGVLFFLATSFWCIRKAPFGKWALTAFYLNPNILVGTICITADTVTFSAVGLYAVQTISIICKGREESVASQEWLLLLVFAILLSGVKASYIPVAALPLAIPILCPKLRNRKPVFATIGIVGLCLLLFFAWYYVAIQPVNTCLMWNRNVNPDDQVSFILSNPDQFAFTILQTLSVSDYFQVGSNVCLGQYRDGMYLTPPWLLAGILILAVLIQDRRELAESRRGSWLVALAAILVAVALVTALLICVAIYVSFTHIGEIEIDGMQPRYFAQVGLLLILAITALVLLVRKAIVPLANPKPSPVLGNVKLINTIESAIRAILCIAIVCTQILAIVYVWTTSAL